MLRERRTTQATKVTVLAGLAGWMLASTVLADHGRSKSSQGVSNQRGSYSRPASRGHAQPSRNPRVPRSLLPPAGLGSAAGAQPGFYSRNLSAPSPRVNPVPGRGAAPAVVPYPYPYPVYVLPPELSVSPSQVVAPSAQDVRQISTSPRFVAPREVVPTQPVIVIQQPVAPQPGAPQPAAAAPPIRRSAPPVPSAPPEPRSTEPAAVRFSIAPAAAEVYLDDELLGTGSDLNALQQAMLLRPGVYVLEVTHPEHRQQRLVFGVQAEEPMEVAVDLTAEKIGRRSRIR